MKACVLLRRSRFVKGGLIAISCNKKERVVLRMTVVRVLIAIVATVFLGVRSVPAQTSVALWEMRVPFPTGTGLVPTGTSYLPPNQTGTNQWPTTGAPYPAGTPTNGALAGNSSAILSAGKLLTASTYTSPAGNGSQYSFSSNNWSPADYYQVVLPTTGYTGLSVSWDQARSSTGPAAFKLQMSTNGTSFTDLLSYSVLQSGGAGAPGTWTSGSYNSLYTNTFSLPVSANNQANLYLRFTNSEAAVSNASGSNRIDNISVTAVPEPSTFALVVLGIGFGGMVLRRRSAN